MRPIGPIKKEGETVAQLIRVAGKMGLEMLDELKVTGRTLAVSLSRSTQPYGADAMAKALGMNAVQRDIRRVFGTPGRMYQELQEHDPRSAPAFWSAWRGRNERVMRYILTVSPVASRVAVISVPVPAIHKAARRGRGRVVGKGMRAVVLSKMARDAYIRDRQKRVGLSKGGWASAAAALGGTGTLPAWITRHVGGSGGAQVIPDPVNPQVIIRTDIPWAREVLRMRTQVTAENIAREKLIKRLRIIHGKRRRV